MASCVGIDFNSYQKEDGELSNETLSVSEPLTEKRTLTAEKRAPIRESAKNLQLSIEEAILITLENNQAFRVERLNTEIKKTYEMQERAFFDPTFSAAYSVLRESKETGQTSLANNKQSGTEAELFQLLPSGTEVAVGISTSRDDSSASGYQHITRSGISITQALLQGRGSEVNLANLHQARLNTLSSQYELRGFAEALVAEVEKTCWDYILAERRMAIFKESLKLAEDQLWETMERIQIGELAEVERFAAQAEVALRREALINARSDLALYRLKLNRLLNQPGSNTWNRELSITDMPVKIDANLDQVEKHVRVALKWRPEINQARLEIKQGNIELVKTKNGLLPVMDLFISLGKTGYANSFRESIDELDGRSYDISAGIRFEYPIDKRAARARHKRAGLTRRQKEEALRNLNQLVEMDVRSAFIEIDRTKEQIAATAATRKLQEATLNAETEKFRVGKSTAMMVAMVQRDLVSSRVAEIEAVAGYLKALIDLYRQEGSLLERKGIQSPGKGPVDIVFQDEE